MTRTAARLFAPTGIARALIVTCLCALFTVSSVAPVQAQGRGLSLVRDAEIEALVNDYARPLMRAAGMRPGSVAFYLVNDSSFNAFVSGRGMFLNTGLLLQSETPEEVIGVIAHELGHLIGAHQIRLRERIDDARRLARISTLLGIGLGAAGAASGSNSVASAGLGVASAGNSIGLREVLRYQRGEETSADRTAVTLLEKTKQSGRGMLVTFQRLSRQLGGLAGRVNPYAISHPLPNERIAGLRDAITRSPYYERKSPASLQLRHDMMRAKIAAYTGGSRYAQALLQGKDLQPVARLYGRAIVSHLYGSPRDATALIDRLIKQMPKNAYVHEMRGEIFLRSGNANAAVSSFRRAVQLDKTRAGFINVELGHALVSTGKQSNMKEAVAVLNKGLARDPSAVAGYQYLAIAYGALGQEARALLATAELNARTGRKRQARDFATRAQRSFKRGSPPWLRAQDIITQR
ncbi:MAG: M48 family metalloprotease [Pseudomonadota bacterium]